MKSTSFHYLLVFIITLSLTNQCIVLTSAAASSKASVTKASTKQKQKQQQKTFQPRELSSGEMAAAGAFATAFGVTLVHPIDTIKTLQQSNEGIGLNMLQATNKIMKVCIYVGC